MRRTLQLVMMTAVLAAAPSWGISTENLLQPIVSREQYEALCRRIQLNPEGRLIADVTFEQYQETMRALDRKTQEAALPVGLRLLREVVSGRQAASLSQIAAAELMVLQEYDKAWPQADDELTVLLDDVQQAAGEAAPAFAAAARALRRQLMLHPRSGPFPGADSRAFFGDNLDVLTVIDAAMKSGEMQAMPQGRPLEAATLAEIAPELASLMKDYELELDQAIKSTWPGWRRAGLCRQLGKVGKKDEECARTIEREDCRRWLQLYQLNRAAVDRVGDILAARVSPQSKTAWEKRVHKAWAPWLFGDDAADAAMRWIAGREDLAAELAQARTAYDEYVASRDAKRVLLLNMIHSGRTSLEAIVYPSGASPRHDWEPGALRVVQQLDQKMFELIAAEASARAKLISMVPDALRGEMTRAIMGKK